MPLRPPRRLPKSFNRAAGSYARKVAGRYGIRARFARRRSAAVDRVTRRWSKLLSELARACRFWAIVLAIVALAAGIAVVLFSPMFNVRQIQIRRQDARIDVQELEQKLSPLFHSRLPFVTNAQVEELVRTAYPDVQRLEITKQYPATLTVSVFLDPVVAEVAIEPSQSAVSGANILTNSGSHAYLTAQGTLVLSPIALRTTSSQVIRITDWAVAPADRTTLISAEALKTVFEARATLQDGFGLHVGGIQFFLRAQEFHLQAGKVWLWFDLSSPLPVQFERFREFLKTSSLDQVKQYIDLRISDRVIFQ